MEKYKFYLILLTILVLLFIIVISSKTRVYRVYKKYSKIKNTHGIYGKDFVVAAKNQLNLDINLAIIDGILTDCYSTKSKTLMMSEGTCNSNSLSAIVIISHELGHAVQHKNKHPLLYISNFLRGLTKITNFFIIPLALASLICLIVGNPLNGILINIAIILFAIHCLSNLLMIPLEKNASSFAMKYLKENKYLNFNEVVRAKRLLRWASRTYILNFLNGIILFNLFKRKKRK